MIDPLSLVGTIPTALKTLDSLSSLFQNPYRSEKIYQENSKEIFKQGGKLRGHNKYNAPSHSKGGQLVDNKGIPNPMGNNEIEKDESKYSYSSIKNDTYIFTPEDTKKVNKLTKKYKKANTSELDKNALELEVQRIENNNEMKKQTIQYKKGGKLKYAQGGPLPTLNNLSLNPMVRGYSTQANRPINTLPTQVGPEGFGRFTNKNMAISPLKTDYKAEYSRNLPEANLTLPEKTTVKDNTNNPLKTLDTLRNLTLATDSLNFLKGPEKENPIMTNYSQARQELNKLDSNLDPLKEQTTQASNQLRNVNRNSSSSYNTFANREAQRVANLQQSLSNINLQERNLGNSIAGQRAQFESQVAMDNKRTLQQNRINNQQNAANTRTIKSEVASDLLYDLDRRSTIENNKNFANATRKEQMSLLSTMFENFDVSDVDIDILVKQARGEALSSEEKNRALELIKYKQNAARI